MKPKQRKRAKLCKRRPAGPWATVTAHQAKLVQDKVDCMVGIAVWGKGSSDDCGNEEVTIEEVIDVLVDLATSAFTCLLLLNPTRGRKNQKPGPLANISQKEAKGIRERLQFVLDFGTDGVRGVQRCKKFELCEFFTGFSMLKKYAKDMEQYLCPDNYDE